VRRRDDDDDDEYKHPRGSISWTFLHFQDLWELHAESSVKIRVARRDYEVRSYNRDLKSGSAFL